MISKASAPGKIILFGEHFVVHGTRAIVGAINKRVTVTSEKNDTAAISISSSLGKATIPITEEVDGVEKKFRPFFFVAKEVISDHNFQHGVNIELNPTYQLEQDLVHLLHVVLQQLLLCLIYFLE